jgi:hypothetical protein
LFLRNIRYIVKLSVKKNILLQVALRIINLLLLRKQRFATCKVAVALQGLQIHEIVRHPLVEDL